MTNSGDQIKVSVCMSIFNRYDYVKDTIDGLLSQDIDSFEIIAVNDGSSDPRVKDILDSYSDPRLHVIHQANAGFVRGIRRAISVARGQYIAIQGHGDVSLPNRLREQAAVLDADAKVGVVGCIIEDVVFGGKSHGTRSRTRPVTLAPRTNDFLGERNHFSHGEVMFRRASYDAAGGYREFFTYAQDRDLWIRMSEVCEMRIVPEVLYERRIFLTDGVAANRSKLLLQKSYSNFARQCYHDRQAVGIDYVTLYGGQAGLFRGKFGNLADFCAKQAMISHIIGNDKDEKFFIHTAMAEKKTPKVCLTYLLLTAARRSALIRKLVQRTLGRKKGLWAEMKSVL